MRCRPLLLAAVVVVAAFSLLAAGCGGGGSPGIASVASSTTTAVTTPRQNGTTTTTGSLASAFAFARCMRSHGIPNWPDPNSSGFFDKSRLQPLGLSVARVRGLEEGPCNIPLPTRLAPTYTITPADQTDYREGATCMRRHGFPGFPDPTFQNSSVQLNIPSSIDQDSPRFKNAAGICTTLIPAGLPYSNTSGG